MTVEIKPQFILITDIVPGEGYVKSIYIGYSKTEAVKIFKNKYYGKKKKNR